MLTWVGGGEDAFLQKKQTKKKHYGDTGSALY